MPIGLEMPSLEDKSPRLIKSVQAIKYHQNMTIRKYGLLQVATGIIFSIYNTEMQNITKMCRTYVKLNIFPKFPQIPSIWSKFLVFGLNA